MWKHFLNYKAQYSKSNYNDATALPWLIQLSHRDSCAYANPSSSSRSSLRRALHPNLPILLLPTALIVLNYHLTTVHTEAYSGVHKT
jgi:hypothetical protein